MGYNSSQTLNLFSNRFFWTENSLSIRTYFLCFGVKTGQSSDDSSGVSGLGLGLLHEENDKLSVKHNKSLGSKVYSIDSDSFFTDNNVVLLIFSLKGEYP